MPPQSRLESGASPMPYEPVSEQVLRYWKEKLASPPFLALPTDYPRVSDQVCASHRIS